MESMTNSNDEGNAQHSSTDDNTDEKEDVTSTHLIPGYETFDKYLEEAYDSIKVGIKAANSLPIGENYNYYACFPSFNDARNKDIERLLATMQTIIKTTGGSGKIRNRDIEEKFDLLLDINDVLIDRANICMDEEMGILKNPEVELVVTQASRQITTGSWNVRNQACTKGSDDPQNVRLLGGKNIQRPQLMFKDKVDNSPTPWQPRIKEKPNSLKPLALYIEDTENGEVFCHPYEFELDRFQVPEWQLIKSTPIQYKSLDDTQLIMIETAPDIEILLEDLKNYNEIAIDLEHHSYRTFQGITCLMQISTADTDYLIDTLALRSELYQLNEIFTKPSFLKVFHGAELDIQWLQKDLSLYVVNLFDTHQAAKQLNLPYLSLAYLLKKYCNVDPNKHFQLADWRIRPIPEELIKYARDDTHYLLYIKDILKNELIESANGQNNILKAVYDRGTEICKRTYVKPQWTEESCMSIYRKTHKMFNNKQMYALKELHRWRDVTAREEDDSIGYVLPNHMLLNIAETLPREIQGILACCNPIPPLVRQNLLKLHKIVLKAREQPLIKTIQEQDFRRGVTSINHAVNLESWIHAHHDIPNGAEARADLHCLLDKTDIQLPDINGVDKHTVTIFDTEDGYSNETETSTINKSLFISPFKRYKCVIPMIAEEEAKKHERRKKEEEKEKDLDEEIIQDEKVKETEIKDSKNRVYEHFMKVTQQSQNETQKSSKKKNKNLILGQMHGRKRKRESNITKEDKIQKKKKDFNTPMPSLDNKIVHLPKKVKLEMQNAVEERQIQETLMEVHKNKHSEVTVSKKFKKKKKNKKNDALAKQQNISTSNMFDFKSVDFSSFQGGSTTNYSNPIHFQQPKPKRKGKKKWKKQKLGI